MDKYTNNPYCSEKNKNIKKTAVLNIHSGKHSTHIHCVLPGNVKCYTVTHTALDIYMSYIGSEYTRICRAPT